MKRLFSFTILLVVLMNMIPTKLSASIEIKNGDGVTIYYKFTNDNTELSVTYRGNSYSQYTNEYRGNIVIPESVEYDGRTYQVTSIGMAAFCECNLLNSVTIPNSVTSIDAAAFEWCTGLTSITFPNSVTSIGSYAFHGCYRLESVIIPNSVTSIGGCVFIGCDNLKSIDIPNSVTKIGDYTFQECGLTSVTIGDGVTTIGESAFNGCAKLMFVIIGAQVATIGRYALSCSAVIEIDSKAQTPPVCGTQALGSINKSECKLFVPDNSLAAYQAADQWKDFTLMEEGAGTGGQCAKPTISYQGSKLKFTCQTEGVSFYYNVTTSPSEGEGEEFSLLKSYTVTVYAKKEGYKDSEPAIEVVEIPESNGDMNSDGKITITDAVLMIDRILKNQ